MAWDWVAVGQTLVGTFVGAGLAFGANALARRIERRQERRAAGNVAVTTLAMMGQEALAFGVAYVKALEAARADLPGLPDWAVITPMLGHFSSELSFDRRSLEFLVAQKHANTLMLLATVERQHRDLRSCAMALADAVQERQRHSQNLDKLGKPLIGAKDIASVCGHELVGRIQGLHEVILHYHETDRAEFEHAAKWLNRALIECLGAKGIASFSIDDDELKAVSSIRVGRTNLE